MKNLRFTWYTKFYKKGKCFFAVDKDKDLVIEVDLETSKIEPSHYFEYDFGEKCYEREYWDAFHKAIKNLTPFHKDIQWEDCTQDIVNRDSETLYIKFTSTLIPNGAIAYAEIKHEWIKPPRYEDDPQFDKDVLELINDALDYEVFFNN